MTPPSPTVLWERTAPTDRHSQELTTAIAEAAMTIADREGLDALSVKRVAAKVGLPTPRLGEYLTSKDDLYDFVFDAFYGEVTDPATQEEWRADLRELALVMKAAIERHPWVLELFGTRPPYGPNGLRSSERSLATMDGLDLPAAEVTSAVNTVLAYVCGSVRRARRSGPNTSDATTARYLVEVAASGSYPRVSRMLSASDELTSAESFSAGLDYVLDGIAAALAVTTAG